MAENQGESLSKPVSQEKPHTLKSDVVLHKELSEQPPDMQAEINWFDYYREADEREIKIPQEAQQKIPEENKTPKEIVYNKIETRNAFPHLFSRENALERSEHALNEKGIALSQE